MVIVHGRHTCGSSGSKPMGNGNLQGGVDSTLDVTGATTDLNTSTSDVGGTTSHVSSNSSRNSRRKKNHGVPDYSSEYHHANGACSPSSPAEVYSVADDISECGTSGPLGTMNKNQSDDRLMTWYRDKSPGKSGSQRMMQSPRCDMRLLRRNSAGEIPAVSCREVLCGYLYHRANPKVEVPKPSFTIAADFDIFPSELVVFCGPVGSGKSTLLSCLAKATIPLKGSAPTCTRFAPTCTRSICPDLHPVCPGLHPIDLSRPAPGLPRPAPDFNVGEPRMSPIFDHF